MSDSPVRELSPAECWAELEKAPIGRLALAVGREVDIFPLNFVVDDEAVYFRTAPGTKLLELTVNDHVALEVDDYTDTEARSVVLKGRAEQLEQSADIAHAESLGLAPWVPTLKFRWVRIRPDSITGRAFDRTPEPDRGL